MEAKRNARLWLVREGRFSEQFYWGTQLVVLELSDQGSFSL